MLRREDEVLAGGANTRTTNESMIQKTKQKMGNLFMDRPKVNRPKRIFSNLAISLDGKISPIIKTMDRFPSESDRRRMDELRFEADAVLLGASTIREDPFPIKLRYPDLAEKRKHPLNVVLSQNLNLPPKSKFFESSETERLIFTTSLAPKEKIEDFKKYSELIIIKSTTITPEYVVAELAKRKINSLLVEGGGEIMFSFLKSKLIDEIFVTICPLILGGKHAPTLVEGDGFSLKEAPRLALIKSEEKSGELFLHYKAQYRG